MKNIQIFLSENFPFLVVKFSIYLNRNVFVMDNYIIVVILNCVARSLINEPQR